MAKPDMELGNELLEKAAEANPQPLAIDDYNKARGKDAVTPVVSYMVQHGLVEGPARRRMGTLDSYAEITITAKGLDYISEDGGLTAQDKLVIVRLEAQTIRDLVMAQVELSQAPKHEKTLIRRRLEALPEEGLKHLTSQLVELALKATPDAIQTLRTLL
ncbi:hypothetical protein [Salinicola halophyticus]|uniref:hypothetical protein n=1 Tax=Salinicola halophyticus TaxID=1808881 RepID=UPI003F477738